MKTSIVTGGGHGIGKAIVEKLLHEGCQTIALDINSAHLQALKQELPQVETLQCNVGVAAEVNDAIKFIEKKYGKIDYLVNNAGISVFEPIETLSLEMWNEILSVNLSSIFYAVKYGKHLFTDNSAIVNIASTRALMSEANGEAYGASKGGIVALTHALAVSLSPKTRVNSISPGWIEINNYDTLSTADHAQHLTGKVGKANDIAETAWFLLSEKSAFISGQNIVVDGGMTRKMIYV
ncbi:MAG: SDR family oxidoreductase [Paludibacter sp.]|jgi:NAD(P)-dependent dehydrogenase (short-subunit alcohol dehydrogenase family)|nr:SDR family oxidoreductase [Paludibacter sp.]